MTTFLICIAIGAAINVAVTARKFNRRYAEETPQGYPVLPMIASAAGMGAVFYGLPLWGITWLVL